MRFKLNFDGSSKGNPGLARSGAVIYNKEGNECWANSYYIGDKCTNNYAEYAGLYCGMKKAHEMGIKDLKVEGDSLLVINQMKGIYKCNAAILMPIYEKTKALESKFDSVEYVHVLRKWNKRADALSNVDVFKCNPMED